MMNFSQYWNQINGEMYAKVPAPVKYKMADYGSAISSGGSFGNVEDGCSYHLRPLEQEDMARYAADDVVDHYGKLHQGKNPYRLGDHLTDEEFKDFMGHTW